MDAKQRLKNTKNVGKVERVASVLAGAGMLAFSVTRFSPPKVASAIGSAYLLYRGISGKDPVYRALEIRRGTGDDTGIQVLKSVTIMKSREELYTFWRNFENLPRFMEHLKKVTVRSDDGRVSHWVTRLPMGMSAEWDAEILEDVPNERISWRSLPGSMVETIGSVTFRDAPPGMGTEIVVALSYRQPAGSAGAFLLKLFGEEPAQQIQDDLRRLKEIMETGMVISTLGQTSGRLREVEKERKQLGMRSPEALR